MIVLQSVLDRLLESDPHSRAACRRRLLRERRTSTPI
jgi:hypothetical protein